MILSIVRRIADRVAVMQQGKLVETNQCQALFHSPLHPYTQQLINADPRGTPVPVTPNAPTLLQAENLRVWFPIKGGLLRRTQAYIKAVTDMNFTLLKGQSLGVVGESGSGKSTTGMAILKLLSSQGMIRYLGEDLQPLKRHEMLPFRK